MTALARTDVPHDFQRLTEMARLVAASSLLPGTLRDKPANVAIILMGARALDVPAFWALQSMHVIDGKLTMSADLMRALVIRAGHSFRVLERTAQKAVVEIIRKGDDKPYVAEFTWDDAKLAELAGKSNWKKYPKAMLVARATSLAVRDHCPDVLFGVVYTPDELGADTDADGNPLDGQVIEVPTGDQITELVFEISGTTTATFRGVWDNVMKFGWALEKIPDGGDMSLADHAADHLAVLAGQSTDPAEVRELWKLANGGGLLDMAISERDGTRLGTFLPARVKFLEEAAKVTAEKIDTDNAQQLREAAGKSWGDTEEVVTGEIVEAADRG